MTDYQRVIAEINLDAIAYNIQNIKKRTDPSVKIMAVVKADAYGHGAVEISKVLLENGADWLAVAIIEEAIQLRNSGVTVPILILGYTPVGRIDDILNYDLIQTIYSFENAEKLSLAGVRLGKTAQIHIKIDTGMGRIGFLPNENSVEEIFKISNLKNIDLNGMYTHFSTADEIDKGFTRMQQKRFLYMVQALEEKGIDIPIKHVENSAGIIDFEDLIFNMVRPGIILYGLYPSDAVMKDSLSLKPVMSIKTHVSFVKEVEAGTPIGYGRTYVTYKKSIIATVPVGYADGFIRGMKNGGRVIVGGGYAPVVGRICMDQFMIDVTNIPGVAEGDEVVLLGCQDGKEITADQIAQVLDTISYEVCCMVSKRVPRVYMKKGKEIRMINYIV